MVGSEEGGESSFGNGGSGWPSNPGTEKNCYQHTQVPKGVTDRKKNAAMRSFVMTVQVFGVARGFNDRKSIYQRGSTRCSTLRR